MRRAGTILAALCLVPAIGFAATEPAAEAARNAAFSKLKAPGGVGGCVFAAVPVEVRRETIIRLLAAEFETAASLKAAVARVTPECAGRAYDVQDHALIGSVMSAFRKAASALYLAHQLGVGQDALDYAWQTAPASEKTSFYAVADEFLDPETSITRRALNTAALAERAGLDAESAKSAASFLRMYFTNVALSERAEAALQRQGVTPDR